ncbi:MAG: DUF11 domain-containing protein, partial [Flavobacteriaceae bacterium]|nr:DUF11 domain-containing protein [Flavobacteriaceae bacterium]
SLEITATVNATTGTVDEYKNTATVDGYEQDPVSGNDTAFVSTTPVPQTDLEITKTVDKPTPKVGSYIVFTITVTNNGPSASTNVSVSDLLPVGYTYVSDNGATSYDDATGAWTVGSLANTSSASLEITATVNATTGTVDEYKNTATVDGDKQDSVSGNDTAFVSTTPVPQANLVITKTNGVERYIQGADIVYIITVTNNGPSASENVNIVDVFPEGIMEGSWSKYGGIAVDGYLDDIIVSLANEATVTYTVTLMVPTTFIGDLTNLVVVTSNTEDPSPECTTCGDVDKINTLYAVDDIANTYMDIPVSGNLLTNDEDGEDDVNTITQSTITTTEGGVVTIDTITGEYNYIPVAGFVGDDTFEYTICDDVDPQICSTASVTITVMKNPVEGVNNNPVATNDTATTEGVNPVKISVLTNDFDINKDNITLSTDLVTQPEYGTVVINDDGTITYTPEEGYTGKYTFVYQICDDGEPSLCDTAIVSVTVLADDGINNTYANDDSYNVSENGTMTANVMSNDTDIEGDDQVMSINPIVDVAHGELTINEDGSFTYTPEEGYIGSDSFVYEICDDNEDSSCDQATVIFTVNPLYRIDLDITKEVNVLEPYVGENIEFTITVTNTGKNTATNINIKEELPFGYTYVSHDTSTGVYDGSSIWNIPSLSPDEQVILVLEVMVSENADYDSGDYINTASIETFDQIDPNEDNNIAESGTDPTCLLVYNEFSPNADGFNDVFEIRCLSDEYPENRLEVFNRWGSVVYTKNNYDNTWDGKTNVSGSIGGSGTELPSGTYFYVLDLKDGSIPKQGWIYIVR